MNEGPSRTGVNQEIFGGYPAIQSLDGLGVTLREDTRFKYVS